MNAQPIHTLLVHGSIVLLSGILSGVPFWIAIIRDKDRVVIRSWRVAHATLISCGMIMIAVSLASPYYIPDSWLRSLLVWAFATSGYAFMFALVVGAATGIRGLTPRPFGFETLLFLGHMIGACGTIVGTCILLCVFFSG